MMLNFDATKFNPEQGVGKHPTGKFPAVISAVSVEENRNKDGGYFSVTFTTQVGQIDKNYNLWFSNPNDGQKKAIEIAQNNLSALCHATGVFRLGDGKELINARCMIEVTPQKKDDKYNEVSRVYDANGNEPGKAPAQPQPQQQGGGWGGSQPQQPPQQPMQPPAQVNGAGWQPQQQTAPAASPGPQPGQGWQPGGTLPQTPPWGNK